MFLGAVSPAAGIIEIEGRVSAGERARVEAELAIGGIVIRIDHGFGDRRWIVDGEGRGAVHRRRRRRRQRRRRLLHRSEASTGSDVLSSRSATHVSVRLGEGI